MSRRTNDESVIVRFFQTQELGKAQTLLNVVREIVRQREGKPAAKTPKKRTENTPAQIIGG